MVIVTEASHFYRTCCRIASSCSSLSSSPVTYLPNGFVSIFGTDTNIDTYALGGPRGLDASLGEVLMVRNR